MFPKVNPTTTKSWASLLDLARHSNPTIVELLEKNPERVKKYSFDLSSLHFDFSKNSITDEVLETLLDLAKECQLSDAIHAFLSGEVINETEKRQVLHTELRRLSDESDYSQIVKHELSKIDAFSEKVYGGRWMGFSNKPITDVVNIGIGGSDLGPRMVTYALRPYWKNIKPHFVSNVDGQQLNEELSALDADTTLFIIASKTFTTQETLANAESAKAWFLENGGTHADVSKHFVAVSTNEEAVNDFGIDSSNMFAFWDWVGGRYSLWSSIGLSIACTVGYSRFEELLKGAETMDKHFRDTPLEHNIPVLAALIGIWYNNFCGYQTNAILPYDHRLRFLPSYLQQADMESNGKSIDRNGQPVTYQTGPIIWGEAGTNGQHAFYQLIHQGTKVVPSDFIAVANAAHDFKGHHDKLLANFFAQPEALARGKSEEKVRTELSEKPNEEVEQLLPYKIFGGNKPTTSIIMEELTPFNLGTLIAFYEHKIFAQGIIWNIFSFDQWGVELGKQLAKPILGEIERGESSQHGPSTKSLMEKFYSMRR